MRVVYACELLKYPPMPSSYPDPEDPKLLGRLSAIAETVLVLVGAALLAQASSSLTGLPGAAALEAVLFAPSGPDWSEAAAMETIRLGVRYGLTFAVVVAVCFWIGGPSRRLSGLSFGGRSVFGLVGFGIVMGVALSALARLGHLAHYAFGVGEALPVWDLIQNSGWTPDFWLFMAASSFLAIPIIEELFFRSYALGRYRMHFSSGGAVILCALFFWISHGQYLKPDPLLLYNSVLVFVVSLFAAWSVVRTGSVIPAVVAHSVANIPMTPLFMAGFVVFAAMLVALFRRAIVANLADFWRVLRGVRERGFLILTALALAALLWSARATPALSTPLLIGFVALAGVGLVRRAPARRRRVARKTAG